MLNNTYIIYRIQPQKLESLAESVAQLFTGYLKEGFYSKASDGSTAHGLFLN